MAFKDIEVVLYDGHIKVNYTDASHRYQARPRVLNEDGSFKLPEDNPKAWGKALFPKGTTTLLGDTLEKKGLQRYPLSKMLMYAFGFYEFTDDNGEKKMGYSKHGVASFFDPETGRLHDWTKEEALEHISYASKADLRWTDKGASIGSVVHDAIENFVKGNPDFNIHDKYAESLQAAAQAEFGTRAGFESEKALQQALDEYGEDTWHAELAYEQFVKWWNATKPELLGAEDLIYSKTHNICGTFDGLLRIKGKGVVLADWKTSNASTSESACMPEGINYQYFLQSAIYAMAWMEMGREKIDDLLIVSCRKDGGFTTIFASDLGLTVDQCINWARAVIVCKRMMETTKEALWQHGIESGAVVKKVSSRAKKVAA